MPQQKERGSGGPSPSALSSSAPSIRACAPLLSGSSESISSVGAKSCWVVGSLIGFVLGKPVVWPHGPPWRPWAPALWSCPSWPTSWHARRPAEPAIPLLCPTQFPPSEFASARGPERPCSAWASVRPRQVQIRLRLQRQLATCPALYKATYGDSRAPPCYCSRCTFLHPNPLLPPSPRPRPLVGVPR
jgi:hypothetical protein